jgi:micrococcal nuclease
MTSRGLPKFILTIIAGTLLSGWVSPSASGIAPISDEEVYSGLTVQETGVVSYATDGDTVWVNIDKDGTNNLVLVRLIGIQAMELTNHSSNMSLARGDCGGVPATIRLNELIKGQHVALVALHKNSANTHQIFPRPYRHIYVNSGGQWRDVGVVMLAEGHALPFVDATESAWNFRYMNYGQQARKKKLRMWKPTQCGTVYSSDAELKFTAEYTVPEKMTITNTGDNTVDIGKWWVRDSALNFYTFPTTFKLKADQTVTVRPGDGADDPPLKVYMANCKTSTHCSRAVNETGKTIFNDPTGAPVNMGDGAYLFDPQGNIRKSVLWPKRVLNAE